MLPLLFTWNHSGPKTFSILTIESVVTHLQIASIEPNSLRRANFVLHLIPIFGPTHHRLGIALGRLTLKSYLRTKNKTLPVT